MKNIIYLFLFPTVFLFSFQHSYALTAGGGEIYYKYLGAGNYKVTVVLYFDCASIGTINIDSAKPVVRVYKDSTTLYAIDSLILEDKAFAGPVCIADTDSTTCTSVSYTLPGVRRYVYSKVFNLGSLHSTKWRFYYTGALLGAGGTGRSASITNISTGSIMALQATLNDTAVPNTSCKFIQHEARLLRYNYPDIVFWTAVDTASENDSLVYNLVAGLDGVTGSVTYVSGYRATNPIHTGAGKFNFNTSNGIMLLVPDAIQRPIADVQVSEYKNGAFRGSMMREMILPVVNLPGHVPGGKIDTAGPGVVLTDSVTVTTTKATDTVKFHVGIINPDSNNIVMGGLYMPKGSSFTITGNGTKNPSGNFVWKIDSVPTGTYTFYIAYHDNACPVNNSDFLPYTVIINDTTHTGVTALPQNRQAIIYPNPVKDNMVIKYYSPQNEKLQMSFINTNGQVVKTAFIYSNQTEQVSLSELVQGVYCAMISNEYGEIRYKQVVVKE